MHPGLNEQVDRELAVSSGYQKILDDNGVVNQVIAGNHDDQLGAETGPDSRFSKTFSADRYYQAGRSWPTGASYHAWDEVTNADGTVTPGRDNQNNYVLFSAGGLDFVAVGLSYGVTPAAGRRSPIRTAPPSTSRSSRPTRMSSWSSPGTSTASAPT